MSEPTTPAISKGPSNQDLFLWALFLLGGADRDVDVEEIYLKCFEIAPSRPSRLQENLEGLAIGGISNQVHLSAASIRKAFITGGYCMDHR